MLPRNVLKILTSIHIQAFKLKQKNVKVRKILNYHKNTIEVIEYIHI